MKPLAAALALLTFAACAPDLRDDFPFDGELPEGNYVTFEDQGDGSFIVRVDATYKEAWVYVDMLERKDVPASEAVGGTNWDLAFQRFKIISNSGVDGVGTVETAVLEGQDFDALTQAPASGYLQDAADGDDSNGDVDSPFLKGDGWYSYSLVEHKLATRDVVYVVHARGSYFKLKMLDYYDAAGTGAKPSFRWAPVSPP